MNPDFTPPARFSSSSGRRAESLSAESPGSQARRKLEELAVELGAPAATAHGGQRDSMFPATSKLGRTFKMWCPPHLTYLTILLYMKLCYTVVVLCLPQSAVPLHCRKPTQLT